MMILGFAIFTLGVQVLDDYFRVLCAHMLVATLSFGWLGVGPPMNFTTKQKSLFPMGN